MNFRMAKLLDGELEVLARGTLEFFDLAPGVYGALHDLAIDELLRRRGHLGEPPEAPGMANAVLRVRGEGELRSALRHLAANRVACARLGSPAAAEFFDAALADLFGILEAQAWAVEQAVN